MSDVLAAAARPVPTLSPWSRRCWAAIALVAIADWLFYGHAVGANAALFLLTLWVGAVAANPCHLRRPQLFVALGILLLALAPLVLRSTLLALLIGLAGTALATRAAIGGDADHTTRIYNALWLLIDGCWRAVGDLFRAGRLGLRTRAAAAKLGALTVWVVPLALGGVFVGLFASANPLIDAWLLAIDPSELLARLSIPRIALWGFAAMLVWPFLFIRRRRLLPRVADLLGVSSTAQCRAPEGSGSALRLLGKASILRALILFNLLFAVQTVLDGLYLWGGVALPDGMSYAGYAHRGAYPLIVTALLAAGFVIAAMRRGGEAAHSPLIRRLVFLWIAQNVMLVVSSILRLDLYVATYSLTHLRVAAFAWMVLVAIGLLLIVARIVLDRSNAWLVAANLISLAAMLYVCSLINFPRVIADYNVAHSRWIAGTGAPLDLDYLFDLGPQAIPAIDRYIASFSSRGQRDLAPARDDLARAQLDRMRDWRAWTYDDWRLLRYLDLTPPSLDSAGGPS